jgi:purine nucleosidase
MTSTGPAATKKLLVDCDTGVDDALALLYLTDVQGIEIAAIGTVHGNIDPVTAAGNTLKVLELAGVSCPVAVGAARPLVQHLWSFESAHGSNGLGSATLPEPRDMPGAVSAAEQLVSLGRAHPGELTLLATGPLTNVALALALEPDLPNLVPELVVMGGAFRSPGNIGPFAEANIGHDPEAASLVFASGWHTMLVSLDVTMATFLRPRELELLATSGSSIARVCLDMLQDYLDYYEPILGVRQCPMHDAVAAALLVDGSLGTYESVDVVVDCSSGPARGATLVDRRPGATYTGAISHAVAVDGDALVGRVVRSLMR